RLEDEADARSIAAKRNHPKPALFHDDDANVAFVVACQPPASVEMGKDGERALEPRRFDFRARLARGNGVTTAGVHHHFGLDDLLEPGRRRNDDAVSALA